jgi:hypothetical protein
VINDDFVIGLNVLRQGYRLVYAPRAHSFERASFSEKDESIRRARIVAGRYQAITMARSILPWQSPLLLWQIVSHKFMRPLVPFMMILAWLATVAALLWPASVSRFGWLYLARPYNLLAFGLEILVCVLAIVGRYFKAGGAMGKLLYLPAFLVNSNLSALLGLYSFFTGKQTSVWQRARRRGESA